MSSLVRHASATSDPDPSPRRGRRIVLLVLAAVVVVALVGAAAVLAAADDRVPRGTTVAGVSVGGMDREELRAALRGPVNEAVSRSVQVKVGDGLGDFDVDPASIGIELDQAATETQLLGDGPMNLRERVRSLRNVGRPVSPVVTVDRKDAEAGLGDQLKPFRLDPRNASVEVPTPSPELTAQGDASWTAKSADVAVTEGRTGIGFDVPAAVTTLAAAVRGGDQEIAVPAKTTQPKVSSTEMDGVDQLIGTFSTSHPCCAPRVTNIHRIAEMVDGTVIPPGETFSLNAKAGRRTAANGYVEAPAIADGEFVSQYGGGVSQFSTTLFNAAWFAGLTIEKHQPHSQYISRYPPGREATLDYDTIDQVILNDTKYPVVIRTATTSTGVTVGLYGHTGDRTVASTTGPRNPTSTGGFSVNVQRSIRQGGSTTGSSSLSWTYSAIE